MSHTREPDKIQRVSAYDGQRLGSSILERASVIACLSVEEIQTIENLRSQAYKFFQMTNEVKLQYITTDHNFGFRPVMSQYSQSPDRPDLNESFAVWSNSIERIPHNTNLKGFTNSILAYRKVVADISRRTLDSICAYYNASKSLPFLRNSCLEINHYDSMEARALLQDKHEDGHLLTLITADAPGLEVEIEHVMIPITFAPGEILLMPGSLLTDMTGGRILPMYHQVRNHGLFSRLSFLYQVNPEDTRTLQPFIYTRQNLNIDLPARVRNIGQAFGLPPASNNTECTY